MTKAQHRIGPCSNCENPHARHDYCDNCGHRDPLHEAMQAELDRLRADLELVRGAMKADDERLRVAGDRVGIVADCDTAEWMADEIDRLRAERDALRAALADCQPWADIGGGEFARRIAALLTPNAK